MKKQLHIYYSGKVQGIGFRYTATDIAQQCKICGWVKNLPDSRVEIIAEGEEGELKDFMQAVGDHFSGYIKDTEIDWLPAKGEYRDFQVKF